MKYYDLRGYEGTKTALTDEPERVSRFYPTQLQLNKLLLMFRPKATLADLQKRVQNRSFVEISSRFLVVKNSISQIGVVGRSKKANVNHKMALDVLNAEIPEPTTPAKVASTKKSASPQKTTASEKDASTKPKTKAKTTPRKASLSAWTPNDKDGTHILIAGRDDRGVYTLGNTTIKNYDDYLDKLFLRNDATPFSRLHGHTMKVIDSHRQFQSNDKMLAGMLKKVQAIIKKDPEARITFVNIRLRKFIEANNPNLNEVLINNSRRRK